MVKQMYCEYHIKNAGMAELADAIDLGSIGNTVQVQVLLPALFFYYFDGSFCIY